MSLTKARLQEVMVENSLAASLVLDQNFTIVSANRRAEEIFVYGTDQGLVGQNFSKFLVEDKKNGPSPKEIFYDGFLGETILIKSFDQPIFVQAAVRNISIEDKSFIIISFQDISIQKKIQRDLLAKQEGLREVLEELTAKNEELVQLDQAKDKFLALVAHELRTPLNAIIAVGELLHSKIYSNEDERDELTSTLFSQCEHLRDLVNDILDLTKIQSGKMDYYLEYLDPGMIIATEVEEFKKMAEGKQIELTVDPSPGDHSCYFDGIRMKQIVANLVSNAIKFNREGGTVLVRVESEGDKTLLKISDTGIGIPEDKLGSIFNQFETIENISNHHKGTGLGLPLVKLMIESQGGSISVSSKYGQGSVFTLTIPKTKVLPEEQYRSREGDNDGFILFDDEN